MAKLVLIRTRLGKFKSATADIERLRTLSTNIEAPAVKHVLDIAISYYLLQCGRLKEAANHLANAATKRDVDVLLLKARLAYFSGRFDEAATNAAEAMSLPGPKSVDARIVADTLTQAASTGKRIPLPDEPFGRVIRGRTP